MGDQRTDRQTDKGSYRVACPQLKKFLLLFYGDQSGCYSLIRSRAVLRMNDFLWPRKYSPLSRGEDLFLFLFLAIQTRKRFLNYKLLHCGSRRKTESIIASCTFWPIFSQFRPFWYA